jgi:hypothetical protein
LAGLDYAPIDACQMNIEGQDLVHDHGVETLNLEPTLYFVPWIIYNQVITKRKLGLFNSCGYQMNSLFFQLKVWDFNNQFDSLTNLTAVACKNAPANTPACSV